MTGTRINKTKRVRVLCTFGAAFSGGLQRVLMDGLPYLNRHENIELEFADFYDRIDVKTSLSEKGVKIRDIGINCPPYVSLQSGFTRWADMLRAIPNHWRIVTALRREYANTDVVYIHTYKELVLATAAGFLNGQMRPAIAWHCHGLDGIPPLLQQLVAKCSRVIAISDSVAKSLTDAGVSPDCIATVLNAVDFQHVLASARAQPSAPLPNRKSGAVVLLPAASVRAVKGMHVLLRAAELVPDLDVWLTGNMEDQAAGAYPRQLVALAQSEKLQGRVHFLGFRSDIYSVMQAADVICVPSTCREGFGLVVVEAMALRKPVIVSNCGALPDLAENGSAAVIIDPDYPDQLAIALGALISRKEYASNLAAYAQVYAQKRFSYERWAREVAAELMHAAKRRAYPEFGRPAASASVCLGRVKQDELSGGDPR